MPCRNAGSHPEQVVQPREVVASAANGFVLDYANLTSMGRKVWDLLVTMEQPQRPHCFAMVEANLAGQHLNAARRRLRSLGWKSLHTPAVPKVTALTGQISPGLDQDPDEAVASRYRNSGGECLLFQPQVVATGHNQPAGVIGLRTSMVRFAGWTLQLIVLYLDSNFDIGQGPNKERTEQALQCIMAARVPWLIIGDFNRSPEEVAGSVWCQFLRGVVLTPDMHQHQSSRWLAY